MRNLMTSAFDQSTASKYSSSAGCRQPFISLNFGEGERKRGGMPSLSDGSSFFTVVLTATS